MNRAEIPDFRLLFADRIVVPTVCNGVTFVRENMFNAQISSEHQTNWRGHCKSFTSLARNLSRFGTNKFFQADVRMRTRRRAVRVDRRARICK